jgi:hypothetical protein
MSKKYKTIINEGWDISKNKMLAKLSDYAKDGWILAPMKFNMVKKEQWKYLRTVKAKK